jgi:histone-lysine N-methyltransferase SETMAR
VSARWVPQLLTTEHRERRLVAITQLFQQYKREGAEFLDSLVTSDVTWVHYFTPESKTASSGNTPILHPPKKVKTIFSAGKIIATVFWDSKGVLHLDFLAGQKPSMHSIIQLS